MGRVGSIVDVVFVYCMVFWVMLKNGRRLISLYIVDALYTINDLFIDFGSFWSADDIRHRSA